jgi:anti-anti-sigma regulatory factor
MEITVVSTHKHNPRLNVIQIVGDLTGHGALELKRYLYICLEEGKSYFLIDLKYAKRIDGLGISVLEQIIERNIHIRLFGVGAEIRWMFGVSGKEALFRIYNVTDNDKAISLIEEEMQEEAEKECCHEKE